VKKAECEEAVRHLCGEWAKAKGIPIPSEEQPSFMAFTNWLSEMGYSRYLNFQSIRGPDADAEAWFDDEFGQSWRN
jgi:hypothetical protein